MTSNGSENGHIVRGLQFANIMLTINQDQARETAAHVLALTELLVQKGLLAEDEVTTTLDRVREEIAEQPAPKVRLSDLGDKYAPAENIEIDCHNRLHLCQARCCTFAFYLTKQDLDEGVARWDYGNPYWIRQGDDGYCVHADPTTRRCTIWAQRPHVCRRYDCREDKRVWLDYANYIPAPMETPSGMRPVAMAEVVLMASIRENRKAREETGQPA